MSNKIIFFYTADPAIAMWSWLKLKQNVSKTTSPHVLGNKASFDLHAEPIYKFLLFIFYNISKIKPIYRKYLDAEHYS